MIRPRLLAVTVTIVALASAGCAGSRASAGAHRSAGPAPSSAASVLPAPVAPVAPVVATLTWRGCDDGFQCATLPVQLDPADPAAGTLELAVARKLASGSRRIGSLLVNPGGPGASAIDFLEGSYTAFPAAVRDRFDLVAFDPRGIGRSAAVRCASTAQLDRYLGLDPAPVTAAALAGFAQANRDLDAGCAQRSGRLLPYVGTTAVADDMDRLRAALGDARLTYLGYSYGTSIGVAYLDRYPTHVRAMVLDGAIDPTLTWEQLADGQGIGFDRAMTAFLAHCQAVRCAFRRQVTGDLGVAFDALRNHLVSTRLPGFDGRTVGPGEFFQAVAGALYSTNSWPGLADALALAERGGGRNLLNLSDDFSERGPHGYAPILESINAVNCIDRPWPRDEASYVAAADRIAGRAPRFGRAIVLSGMSCLAWPVPAVSQPHRVSGAGAPPVLVLGTTRDPATPYEWAQGLAGQLQSAVLVTHVGDGHTVYRVGAPDCITGPVNSYLVDLVAPSPFTC